MASGSNPQVVTVSSARLSFPVWTAAEAHERSQGSNFPTPSVDKAAPSANLLLEQGQADKIRAFCIETFLPYCAAQEKAGEKRNALTDAEVKRLIKELEGDPADAVCNSPFKVVSDKTLALAPETAAVIKVSGNKGVDLIKMAVVNNEQELVVPDPDQLTYPVIKPIAQTIHTMYAGCIVAATLNLYAYRNGKLPGFSAGVSAIIFKADADAFGGGVMVDEDAIFMD